MKKVISIICITLLVALYSCDERDDLRSDIDNLKERVANLEASIEQMNSDISNYQQMVEERFWWWDIARMNRTTIPSN